MLVAREVWANRGRWADAHTQVLKSLEQAPEDPAALSMGAECALELGRPDQAEAYLERLAGIDPDYAPAFRTMARLYLAQGRTEEARARLVGSLDYRRDWGFRDYLGFAELFEALGDALQAEQALLSARQRQPDNPEPELRRARLVWKPGGNAPRAAALLDELLRSPQGRGIPAYLADAELALASGDFPRCRQRLEQARQAARESEPTEDEQELFERLWDGCL